MFLEKRSGFQILNDFGNPGRPSMDILVRFWQELQDVIKRAMFPRKLLL